ncbi:MAG TPA: T9SS type A sorting domain-containing protein [Flavilitoribacter sp.]|nr:T9SS type A sorting domain-containing protein [Flavilitoribacter sp.]
MKTIGLNLILVMGLAVPAWAQISISNSVFPAVGDNLSYSFGNQPGAINAIYTPPGGNQQWDLSNLQASSTWNQIFLDPQTGAGAAAFPTATLMYRPLNSTMEVYLNVTNNEVLLLGVYGDDPLGLGQSLISHYNPPLMLSQAPVQFFDTKLASSGFLLPFGPNDISAALLSQLPVSPDSLRIRTSISRLDVVNAWGTLTIPGGTFDVLRQNRTQYRERRIDAKIPPLGWLDITDIAIQYWQISTVGVDTLVSFHYLNDQSKEPIAVVTLNNTQSEVVSVQYKNVAPCLAGPTARCKPFTVNLTSNGSTSLSALDVNDNSSVDCGGLSLSVTPNSFTCGNIGANTVTLTATNTANQLTSTCTATVTVADPQQFCCAPPTAVCRNATVQLNAGGTASLAAGDINNGSTFPCGLLSMTLNRTSFGCGDLGPNTVTLTVTDINNGSRQCSATVTVQDPVNPEIGCNNITITINGGETVAINPADLAAAMDNCGIADLQASLSSVDCEDVDSVIPVTVTATDQGGHSASCVANISVTGQSCSWTQTPDGIGCADGNNADYDPQSGTFTLTASGCYTPGATADESAFFKHTLCGNGSITAHVAGLTLPGFAGITMRETDAPGAKKVALVYQGGNVLARSVRVVTGGASYPSYIPTPGSRWLRIVRTGNTFQGYHSANGVNWIYSFAVVIPMSSCIQIGLTASGANSTSVVTATFDNVVITPPAGAGNREGIQPEFNTGQLPDAGLWPNPVEDGQANLTLDPSWGKNVKIEVRNEFGQLIRLFQTDAETESTAALDLSGQAPGVYFIRLQNADGRTAALRLVVAGRR